MECLWSTTTEISWIHESTDIDEQQEPKTLTDDSLPPDEQAACMYLLIGTMFYIHREYRHWD